MSILMDLQQFGRKLRELREAKGMSQQRLAQAAGVSQNGLSHWERGAREPGWSAVVSLARVLGVDCRVFEEPVVGDVRTPPKPAAKKKPPAGGAKKRKKGA